jgi:hypothetical protein
MNESKESLYSFDDLFGPAQEEEVGGGAKKQKKIVVEEAKVLRRHPCPSCKKEFSTSGHLARHQRIHTGEKNYACPTCHVRFSRQDNCNQHIKSHTKPSRASIDRIISCAPSMASTESFSDGHVHSTSYAGSLLTVSEADCTEFPTMIPTAQQQHQHQQQQQHKSLYEFLASDDGAPSLVYDSSATEDYYTATNSNSDFISQEDFFQWSAGIILPDAETEEDQTFFTREEI